MPVKTKYNSASHTNKYRVQSPMAPTSPARWLRPTAWLTIALQTFLPLSIAFAPVTASAIESDNPDTRLVSGAMSAGAILSSANTGQAAAGLARSAAMSEVNQSASRWLNQFGSAQIQLNMDENFRLDNSALDMLVPLYDNSAALLFTQWGLRNKEQRNTLNIGIGARSYHDAWMYGGSIFFDNDLTGKNRRVGIGTELWADYLKLSANGYWRITDWHQSRDFADYHERPANGFDLRAEAWLPSYPQFGGKIMYEHYFGEEVALFGKECRKKDPFALTAGLNYTPIPLLTLGAEHRLGKGSYSDSSIRLQLNYRLGEAWQRQVDPASVGSAHALAGSRYDLVARNNHVVLDYKKQERISLALPAQQSGKSGQTLRVQALVTPSHTLERIDWESAVLIAAGGSVSQVSPRDLLVTLPPYQAKGGGKDTYILSAIARDNKGNRSTQATTAIVVTGHGISGEHSRTGVAPDILTADGLATSEITLIIKDENNRSVSGLAGQITLPVVFTAAGGTNGQGATGKPVATTPVPVRLSDISEIAEGEYQATLTAGSLPGKVSIAPAIGTHDLDRLTITLGAAEIGNTAAVFKVNPDNIIADGVAVATLDYCVRDGQGNIIIDPAMVLAVTAAPMESITITPIVEHNGIYSASLTGTAAGEITVTPVVNGQPDPSLSATLRLNTVSAGESRGKFSAVPDVMQANGADSLMLSYTARDASGQIFKDPSRRLAFIATPADGITITPVEEHNGVYSASLTGTAAGEIIVTPVVDGAPDHSLDANITLRTGPVDEGRSIFTSNPESIMADGENAAALTFTARDTGGNIINDRAIKLEFATVWLDANPEELQIENRYTAFVITPVTEHSGVYRASLTGNRSGVVTVTPVVDGTALAGLSEKVTLRVGVAPRPPSLMVSQDTLAVNGSDQSLPPMMPRAIR